MAKTNAFRSAPAPAPKKAEEICKYSFILKGNITWLSVRNGNTAKELADSMGMTEKTFKNRMEAPWTFRLDEVECMARLWGILPPQLLVEPILKTVPLEK